MVPRITPRARPAALILLPALAALLVLLAGGGLPLPGAPAPAAEALGREFKVHASFIKNASAVTDEQMGGAGEAERCEIDLSRSGGAATAAGQGVSYDYFCFSYTERAIVTLTATTADIPYRAYLASGRAVSGAQAWHPGVRVEDSEGRQLGRGAGVAEYNGALDDDAASSNHTREIVVTRDTASTARLSNGANLFPPRNDGMSFLIVYGGNPGDTDLGAHSSKVAGDGLADLTDGRDVIIKIYFQQEFDTSLTWLFIPGVVQEADGSRTSDLWYGGGITPFLEYHGSYRPAPGRVAKPSWDRQLRLNDYWLTADGGDEDNTGIKYCVQPRDYANGGYWHPQAETSVSLTFAPGSNLSGAGGEYEATIPRDHWAAAVGGCHYGYLSGFNPAGPVRAEMQVVINDGQGNIGNMEPFTIIIEGQPARLYLTRTPTTRLSGGVRYVQMQYALTDALGSPLSGRRAGIRWQGADERSRAVIDRRGGGGTVAGGRFNIPITDDAPAGIYRLTLTAGDISRQVAFRVYDLPSPPPAQIVPASISASAVGGGDFTAGGRANFRYTIHDRNGSPISLSAHPVTWSASADGIFDPAGSVDEARQTDGRFGFDLPDNPAPGVYALTIRTVATDAEGRPLASARITFRIIGNPAQYAVAGPDRVPPGGYAVYTVTAADASGSLPNLAGAHGRVALSVSGNAADRVRLFHINGGSLALDREGVGRFRLRADRGTAAGSVTITASSADGAVTGVKTVAIGAAAQ